MLYKVTRRKKKIATLTHVSIPAISTVVVNQSSDGCIKVMNIPICILVPENVNQSLSTSIDSTEGATNNMTDSIYDQNPNVDIIVENLNHVEEFQNDFDLYYDDNSNKSFFTETATVEKIMMRSYNSKAKAF